MEDHNWFSYYRPDTASPVEYTNDFLTLAKLLCPDKSHDDQVDDGVINTVKKDCLAVGPGSIGPPKQAPTALSHVDKLEIEHGLLAEDDSFYNEPKQVVKAEDLFLGFGNKNPSTASCNCLLVKIWLPDTNVHDIDLDVQPNVLKCKTSKYKLDLPLPHPVDVKRSEGAKFSDGLLTVSLKLNREYEFLNN